VTRTEPDAILASLDPEQREVATALGIPVAVIAGAGTGKTRAITHRIAYAAAVGAYDPRATLAVTFTTRAAGELRSRLRALGVDGVAARTFHSAALRQATYFWPRAYGHDLPPVTENSFTLVADAASRLRLPTDTAVIRDLSAEIGWAKVSNVLPEGYPAIARSLNRVVASLEPEQVARTFVTYEELKRDRGRIDFTDILLCCAALLDEHEHIAAEVRRTYRHLVVDEYQDVSPLQQRLLDLWRGAGRDLCVVGDPAQTIHTFAGASSSHLLRLPDRLPGTRVVELVRDYRSTPQVVALANRLLRGSGQRHVDLVAQQPPGPEPELAPATDEATEATDVATWLQSCHADGIDWREMAVLFRINAQSPTVELALSRAGIPYQVRGAERFFERPEVRQAVAAIRAAARTEGELEGMPRVRATLSALGWTHDPPEGAGRVREKWESQNALLDALADHATSMPSPPTLDDLVEEVQRRTDLDHAPVGSGVTVSTLHSAKGLEWDAVALVGIHEGGVPFVLAVTPDQIAEERRLLYVGVTRARSRLRISWSSARSGSGSRRPSRFLDGIGRAQSGAQVARSRSGKRKPRTVRASLPVVCKVCGKGLTSAAERTLARHLDCPGTYDERTLETLKTWRTTQAVSEKLPAYCVFTDATLTAVAEAMPNSLDALSRVSGIGPGKLSKYGADLLRLLSDQQTEA
jgi:DNA helicase-2/ATP-dependent DNA helicase PcrA